MTAPQPATPGSDSVRQPCPARLELCGIPCGCQGLSPSHRGIGDSLRARAAAYRTNPSSEETHRG